MSEKRSTGGRVLAAREAKGLSLRRAARRLGVSPRLLRGWEKGRADIPYAVRQSMVTLYGVPRESLIPDRPSGAARDASNGMVRIGSVLFHLEGGDDKTLAAFLKAVRKERGLSDGDALKVRASDAEFLAELLGGTPEAIVANLQRLLGVDEREAAELSRFMLPSLGRTAVAGALVVGLVAGVAVAGAASAEPSPPRAETTAVSDAGDDWVDPMWAEIGDAAVLYREDVPGAGQN